MKAKPDSRNVSSADYKTTPWPCQCPVCVKLREKVKASKP